MLCYNMNRIILTLQQLCQKTKSEEYSMKKNIIEKEHLESLIQEQMDFEKLNELCEHLKDAICEIFNSCGLYFRIFSRVKSQESLANKILRGNYGSEDNPKKIQDLIGFRIVLYYYDDLSICRDIMESTFQMIDSWSKTNFNADEFKAAKINGVFKFPEEYFKLYPKKLWTLPIDTTFEIQFRTVFFEGWHEIEHDMRYKSLLSDDQFWQGSEELSRMLNCILANLELSDWSLVQLFEQLSYNHYKNANWELMLKSHFRIKMDDKEPLDPRILNIFNEDKEVAKQFFKCSRKRLIYELLKLDSPNITYNLIVQALNQHTVQNQEITAICKELPVSRTEDSNFHRTTLSRLESNTLFHIEIPLLHKETRSINSEFNNAVSILYKWIRFKFNPVFEDIPPEIASYENHLPGYDIKIVCQPENLFFSAKIHHIDSKLVGTLWHIDSAIRMLDNQQLYFCHTTSRDTPYGTAMKDNFIKPSFLPDLSNKIGLVDIVRLGSKAHFVETSSQLENVLALLNNPARQLPVITIVQNSNSPSNSKVYKDGYDMDSFTINGMRLAKVVGLYAHVYMITNPQVSNWFSSQALTQEQSDGSIMIFWPLSSSKKTELFTRQMICDSQFDFNRFAFHDQNIYEKAFRHKLVQMIKDNNIRH